MSADGALVLLYLLLALILFVGGWIRVDVVAVLLLLALVFSSLISPETALAGFSNPAVITIGGVLIMSGALQATGFGASLGSAVLRLCGREERRLLVGIMLTAGGLSAFMNNVGVAALMLPVVVELARRLRIPVSRLLLPLSFGCLLGGACTLIGTPPNLLIGYELEAATGEPIGIFEFLPIGGPILLLTITYVVLLGRRALPSRSPEEGGQGEAGEGQFRLQERFYLLSIPRGSPLDGMTVRELGLGAGFGINLLAILHEGRSRLAPGPDDPLRSGDRLLVEGRPDPLLELKQWLCFSGVNRSAVEGVLPEEARELVLDEASPLVGRSLLELELTSRYKIDVIGVWHRGLPPGGGIRARRFSPGDALLVTGSSESLALFRGLAGFVRDTPLPPAEARRLAEQHPGDLLAQVPDSSFLIGMSLLDIRLLGAFGVRLVALLRTGEPTYALEDEKPLRARDTLVMRGGAQSLRTLRAMQEIEVRSGPELEPGTLESAGIGLAEIMLSPHSHLVGKTPQEISFRDRYGLTVVALWRQGRAYRSNLGQKRLELGDALLVHGGRERIDAISKDPEFLLLTQTGGPAPPSRKAGISAVIYLVAIGTVVVGWLPIALAAMAGATGMVLARCVTIEEAYRSIEWRVVILIACMLSLGTALEETGVAAELAREGVALVGGAGGQATLAVLVVLTALAAQVMPTSAAAVVMAPIGLQVAESLTLDPKPLLMAIAVAASCSFLTPVGHAANLLVMGPGGYRFSDYTRFGLPIFLLVLVALVVIVPWWWPL